MKLVNAVLACRLDNAAAVFAGGVLEFGWEPDPLNNTELIVNGVYYSGGQIAIREGDRIGIAIPSGKWEGTVEFISGPNPWHIQVTDVTWEGKYAGLVHGLSGLFTWDLFWPDDGMVETSAYPAPVPYHVYRAAHAAVDAGPDGFYGQPEARQRALGQILEVIMSWRGA